MDETANQSIEQLMRRFQHKDLSRRRFIAVLTSLGASTTGIATLLASVRTADAAILPPRRPHRDDGVEKHNKHLHQAHVQRQARATQVGASMAGGMGAPAESGALAAVMAGVSAVHRQQLQAIIDDYAEHAVVEDPFFAAPIVGRQAIAQRKLAEMASLRGATIEVTHRFAHGNQIVAEWVVRGSHAGDFLGFPATGRQIEVRGVTVVTREHGKITKESLHYDVADVHRQLSSFDSGKARVRPDDYP
jgi:steroid delta-isomerase-like uncharacterized protein